MMPETSRRAFTLIELLVVIAIIALLVTILAPSLQNAKDLAQKVQCFTTMRVHAMALPMYTTDHDGYFPYGRSFWYHLAYPPPGTPSYRYGLMGEYLPEEARYYKCRGALDWPHQIWAVDRYEPTFSRNRQILPYHGSDNVWQPDRLAMRFERVQRVGEVWLLADGNCRGINNGYAFDFHHGRFYWDAHQGGTNVIYLDGHHSWVPESLFKGSPVGADNGWCFMRSWAWMWE